MKALVAAGDPRASRIFKEEIAKRLLSRNENVVRYLIEEGYIEIFSKEELEILIQEFDFKHFLESISNDAHAFRESTAFYLLERLIEIGGSSAKKILKEESVKRFLIRNKNVVRFLIEEGSLAAFSMEEFDALFQKSD